MKQPSFITFSMATRRLCRLAGVLVLIVGIHAKHVASAQLDQIQTMMANVTLENKVGQQNDTTGLYLMQIPPYDCEPMLPTYFHVVDWSGDGVDDLIFNGPCNPYPQTQFILQTKKGLMLAYEMGGTLLNIEPAGDRCLAWVYGEAIGCLRTASLTEIALGSDGALLSRTIIEWNPEDTLPKSDEYAQVQVAGILRETAREYDDVLKDECTGLKIIGNQVANLKTKCTALLLRSRNDWQLVCAPVADNHWRIAWIKNSSPKEDMNANEKTILSLYEGFQQKNYLQMGACYADSATFQDEVFTLKNGKECRAMWHYLVTNGKDLNVTFRDIKADDKRGTAHWEATYTFSGTGRRVHNVIEASFEFENGKIVRHRDHFKFWKWTRMALGTTGTLLGWTPLVKNKVRKTAAGGLQKFMADKPEYQ